MTLYQGRYRLLNGTTYTILIKGNSINKAKEIFIKELEKSHRLTKKLIRRRLVVRMVNIPNGTIIKKDCEVKNEERKY